MGIVTSVLNWLNRAGATLGMAGVLILMFLILTEVVSRRFFNFSTLVSHEMAGYLLVLVFYMGLGFTLKEGEHIQISVVTDRMSQKSRAWLALGWCFLGLGFTVLLTFRSLQLVLYSYKRGVVALSVLPTPMYLPQGVVFVGLGLLVLQFMRDFLVAARSLRGVNR